MATVTIEVELPAELCRELERRAQVAGLTAEHLASLWLADAMREKQSIAFRRD